MNKLDIELIDRYLFNLLSEAERKAFEDRLLNDKEFKEQFDFVKSLEKAIAYSEENNIREYLKSVDEELEIEKQDKRGIIFYLSLYKYPLSIAAIFIVILTIWQPHKLSNEKLYQNYLADANIIMPNNELNFERVETLERGEVLQLKNYSLEETQLFENAIQLIDKNNFLEAKSILISFKDNRPEATYYLAIAELKTGEINSAINRLELLNKNSSNLFRDDIKYYLALGYIQTNKKKEAKGLLNYLVEHNTKYQLSATEILNSLRWF